MTRPYVVWIWTKSTIVTTAVVRVDTYYVRSLANIARIGTVMVTADWPQQRPTPERSLRGRARARAQARALALALVQADKGAVAIDYELNYFYYILR